MPDSFIQLPGDSTGKKLKTYDEGTPGHVQYVKENEPATYLATYDRIVPAANKYMAVLWNGASGRIVRVKQVWRFDWNVTAVVGIRLEQELRRISARTAGTAVTPSPMDLNDTITAGIAASHNDTAVTDSTLLSRLFALSEEQLLTAPATAATTEAQFLLGMLGHDRNWQMVWDVTRGTKDLTLRNGQGVAVKNITSSTVGSVSYQILFTDEPA